MKTIFFTFILFYLLPLHANDSLDRAVGAQCPVEAVILIECEQSEKDFYLIRHVGRYSSSRTEFDSESKRMICSYNAAEWESKYKISDAQGEHEKTVSDTYDLTPIVQIIKAKGFDMDYYKVLPQPIAVLTYKEENQAYTMDAMYLFSGLENTFENNQFPVPASKEKISTVVFSPKYMKSKDVAADIFETGSNCSVTIK